MSNRTLIEINHDYAGDIDDNHVHFVARLLSYLRGGGEHNKEELERYGVRVFGTRHHSEGFNVHWGTHAKPIIEPASS